MEIATLEEIRIVALRNHANKTTWHFHVMSPTCMLNSFDQYAFVLEAPDENLMIGYLSDHAQKDLAKELSPLLHGSDVMDSNSTKETYEPTQIVLEMKQRALELNRDSIEWHHHMLYPGCAFNQYKPNHVLMIEDPLSEQAVLSITEHDPIDDLKQIENLFFQNKV